VILTHISYNSLIHFQSNLYFIHYILYKPIHWWGQELLILWEHLRSPLVLSCGVRVFPSLIFCLAFCRHCLSFLSFSNQPLYFLSFNLRLDYTFRIFKLVLQRFLKCVGIDLCGPITVHLNQY